MCAGQNQLNVSLLLVTYTRQFVPGQRNLRACAPSLAITTRCLFTLIHLLRHFAHKLHSSHLICLVCWFTYRYIFLSFSAPLCFSLCVDAMKIIKQKTNEIAKKKIEINNHVQYCQKASSELLNPQKRWVFQKRLVWAIGTSNFDFKIISSIKTHANLVSLLFKATFLLGK